MPSPKPQRLRMPEMSMPSDPWFTMLRRHELVLMKCRGRYAIATVEMAHCVLPSDCHLSLDQALERIEARYA